MNSIDSITPSFIEASKKDLLSPHFSMWELCNNYRGGDLERWNFLYGLKHRKALEALCNGPLESIRAAFGKPIHINSGGRWAAPTTTGKFPWAGLDVEIRSVTERLTYQPKSQHTRFEAADIVVAGYTPEELVYWIKKSMKTPWGQAINEVGGRSSWLHISCPGFRLDGSLILGECLNASVGASTTYVSIGKEQRPNWNVDSIVKTIKERS